MVSSGDVIGRGTVVAGLSNVNLEGLEVLKSKPKQ